MTWQFLSVNVLTCFTHHRVSDNVAMSVNVLTCFTHHRVSDNVTMSVNALTRFMHHRVSDDVTMSVGKCLDTFEASQSVMTWQSRKRFDMFQASRAQSALTRTETGTRTTLCWISTPPRTGLRSVVRLSILTPPRTGLRSVVRLSISILFFILPGEGQVWSQWSFSLY